MNTSALPNISAMLENGGQIMVGAAKPIPYTAAAHDGKKTLAMLRRRENETLDELLKRLDAAIATAQSTGRRVDEINTASATRYEI
jgi:hypothetical protein